MEKRLLLLAPALALLASACAGTSGFSAADIASARAPGDETPASPPLSGPSPTPDPSGDPTPPDVPVDDPSAAPGLLAALAAGASGAGGGWVSGLGETVGALGDQVAAFSLLPSPADDLFVTAGGVLSRLGDVTQAAGAHTAQGPGGVPLAGSALAGAIGAADNKIASAAAVNVGGVTSGSAGAPLGVSLLAPVPASGAAVNVALASGGSLLTAGVSAPGGAPIAAVNLGQGLAGVSVPPAPAVQTTLGAVSQTVGGVTGALGGLLGR